MHKEKYIKDRHHLWELFQEFRVYKKANPFLVKDWVGKDGDMVSREKERPLTFDGFRVWLSEKDVCTNIKEYAANKDGVYNEYQETIELIKDICRVDRVEGGMANVYNSSLTARIDGLSDSVDHNVSILSVDPLEPLDDNTAKD